MLNKEKIKSIILKTSFVLLLLHFIICTLLIFTPVTNFLYYLLEVDPILEKSDVIVLLSSGNYNEELFDGNTYNRTIHASRLFKKGFANKILICGGIQHNDHEPISVSIKKYLIELGIPSKNILVEIDSKNTYENILNIKSIIEKEKFNNFLLVTSSYHMYRSLAISKKLGLKFNPAPVPCYEKKIKSFNLRSRHIVEIIREYGAIIYFKLNGWM